MIQADLAKQFANHWTIATALSTDKGDIYVGIHGQRYCPSWGFGTRGELHRKTFYTGKYGAQGARGNGQETRLIRSMGHAYKTQVSLSDQ